MKYSQLFTKTLRQAPKDEVATNAQLLIRAGFIYKEMAGVYAYLPLGLRVLNKIKRIVKEEMDVIDSQEIIMTSLQSKSLWEKTDRWDDKKVDIWFKSQLKNGTEIGLAWSHEEPITWMMNAFVSSYKDLPVYVYQFQTKLRNEVRSKSGIMRTREFIMKDLYSYCNSQKEHEEIYKKVTDAYHTIFRRVGIGEDTYYTFASGGAFTKFSHEFQTLTPVGEDVIYLDRKKKLAINQEVYTDEVLKMVGVQKSDLEKVTASEVGNIFSFGTDKCNQLGLLVNDGKGGMAPVFLGSYGIGISRLMGVLVEKFHDEKGIIWPSEVAPFQVHLIDLAHDQGEAEKIYEMLKNAEIEVFFDDRKDVSAGQKLNDADLIGCPVRLVVSERTAGKVEWKKRASEAKAELLDPSALISKLQS